MSNKNKREIEFPKMSWEKPIEQEILNYCQYMAQQMRQSEGGHKETGWFSNNSFSEKCGAAAMAYETVAEHVQHEIDLRKTLIK